MTRKAVLMSISLPTWYADKLRGHAENNNRSISATIRMALDRMWHKQCSAIEKSEVRKMNGEFAYGNLCGLQEKYNVSQYRIPCDCCGDIAMYIDRANARFLCMECYEHLLDRFTEEHAEQWISICFCDLQSALDALKRSEK